MDVGKQTLNIKAEPFTGRCVKSPNLRFAHCGKKETEYAR